MPIRGPNPKPIDTGYLSLGFSRRLYDNLRLQDELIETPAGDGIAAERR